MSPKTPYRLSLAFVFLCLVVSGIVVGSNGWEYGLLFVPGAVVCLFDIIRPAYSLAGRHRVYGILMMCGVLALTARIIQRDSPEEWMTGVLALCFLILGIFHYGKSLKLARSEKKATPSPN